MTIKQLSKTVTETIEHEIKIDKYHVKVKSIYVDGKLDKQHILNLKNTHKDHYRANDMHFYNFRNALLSEKMFSIEDEKRVYDSLKDPIILDPNDITKEHLDNCYSYNWNMNHFNYKLSDSVPLPRYKKYSIYSGSYDLNKCNEQLKENSRVSSIKTDGYNNYPYEPCISFFFFEDGEIYNQINEKDSWLYQMKVFDLIGITQFKKEDKEEDDD